MEIRDRILDAAKRVYAKHGFRGATTRLIAIEADVNEVTIFRTFGSKAAHMREHRSLLRKSIGELEERPDDAMSMCEGPNCAGMLLTDYVLRLQATGQADADADIQTAVAMLMSSLFGDALMRDIIPNAFPQPADAAPARYVRTLLRALGVRVATERPRVRTAG
jgi:AcrR family transcriptional regulator